jgi:putative ABC transport system permease protein
MSSSTLLSLVVPAGVLALAAVWTALRHPVSRRLALRATRRRPGETALVIAGSLLGTAIITSSLLVGDTLDRSIRASVETQLGPIDQTVTAFGPESVPALRAALDGLGDHPDVDGVAYGVRASGTAAARMGAEDAAVRPSVLLLETDFEETLELGDDPMATGLHGAGTPSEGQAALSEDLAEDLAVAVGDRVTVFAYGAELELEVASILPRLGVAGYSTDFNSQSFNVFLHPGTLADLVAAAPPDLEASPPVALAFVSNAGGVWEGHERTGSVLPEIRERIAGVEGAEADDTKRRVVERAEREGENFSELFLSIGAFAVIAGILLLVNIFVMLAEERKGELGMMRAVGMRRGQLVRSFFIEGSIYAVAAAVLGALLGIGVGAAIVRVAADIFASFGDFSLELVFTAPAASVARGLLVGLIISLVTVLLTSLRVSRLNIIRAIRDIPEPASRGTRVRTLILASVAVLVGGAMTVSAVTESNPALAFAGPGVLALGLGPLLGRLLPARPVVTVLGLAAVGWGIFGPSLFPEIFADAATPVFVVQGLLLTGAAVAVLAANLPTAGWALRALIGGARNLAARIGLAYPLARPFRTVMTLSMYALVVFTLVFISVLSSIFGGQVDDFTEGESGGYDLLVRSSPANPLPASAAAAEPGVEVVAPLRHAAFTVQFRTDRAPDWEAWALAGFDERFLEGGAPALDRRLPEYGDDEAAWRAVLQDPSLVIVDAFFLQQGGPEERVIELGETVGIRDPITGMTVERTVIGRSRAGFAFTGPLVSEESILEVLGARAAATRLYLSLEPGASAEAVGASLEREHVPNGVEARTFRSIVAENQAANLQFMRLMQGYLALGLVVGISGLGVIMVRAVRERRREIGVLRSLGFQAGTVGRSFLLESGFVAIGGLAIGAGLSLATAYQLIEHAEVFGSFAVSFIVPWGEIAVVLALTLVASLLATGWPARQASRIRPAVALRISD